HALGGKLRGDTGHSRYISTRPGESCDEAGSHRVPRICHDNRNAIRRLFCRPNRWRLPSNDDVRLELDQLGSQFGEAVCVPGRGSEFELYRSPFDVSKIPKCFLENSPERLWVGVTNNQHSEKWPGFLLRLRDKGARRCHAAEQADEFPPVHSITSSARASSVGGTLRPSAFAVFKLITHSNFVAC